MTTTTRPTLDRQQLTDTLAQAIKWGRDILYTGYRDPDWHVSVSIYTNGSVRAKLHYGQIDTMPRPSQVFGNIHDADVIDYVSVFMLGQRDGSISEWVDYCVSLVGNVADLE